MTRTEAQAFYERAQQDIPANHPFAGKVVIAPSPLSYPIVKMIQLHGVENTWDGYTDFGVYVIDETDQRFEVVPLTE